MTATAKEKVAVTEVMLGADMIEEAEKPSDDGLRVVASLAEKHGALRGEIADLEAQLKLKQAALLLIEERDLPAALVAIGMKDFTLSDGSGISLVTDYYASIPKERMDEACVWLRANDAADLIKRSVTLAFGRGEDEQAEKLVNYAKQMFPDHSPEDKTTVHAGTLRAFVRDLADKNLPLPPSDVFGIYKRDFAKISPPKAPRKSRSRK